MAKETAGTTLNVDTIIETATGLLEQKAAILVQIGEARNLLNSLGKMGALTPEQQDWVLTYLPKRVRGPRDSGGVEDVA